MTNKTYRVPALKRGLAILDYLIDSGRQTHEQVSRALSLPKTTSYTLLKQLMLSGYVDCDQEGGYYPTFKIFSLGMKVSHQTPVSEDIVLLLSKLRDKLKTTVNFVSYIGHQSVLLHKLDGLGGVHFLSYVGEMKPLHLSGAGKAILAYLPETQFQAYMKAPLEVRTDSSIASAVEVVACRRTVFNQGYAVDDEEVEPGVFCIGVPVFSADGVILGGISTSMIKHTLSDAVLKSTIRTMLDVGEHASRLHGYQGKYPILIHQMSEEDG